MLTRAVWCAISGLALVAILRIVAHDATLVLTWLNAFTLYLYLPSYPALAYAIYCRRKWLAAACVGVIACHLFWVAPDFRPASPLDQSPAAASPRALRIFYSNAFLFNPNYQGILDEITSADPDVVVLAEFNSVLREALLRSPIAREYPFGTDLEAWMYGDVVVRSRVPLEHLETAWVVGRAYVTFNVPLDGQSIRMLCLHSPRPMRRVGDDYDGFWKSLLPTIAAQPEPLVVVGDFNATQHSWVYDQITSGRLRSTHADRGRGYATTWPNGQHFVPPIRIDNAFISPQLECLRCEEGIGAGSDHRPLVLDLRLRSSSAGSRESSAIEFAFLSPLHITENSVI